MLDMDVLIFDVDGTLVDSRKEIVNAVNSVMNDLGLKKRPGKAIMSYVGTGVDDLIRKTLGPKDERYFEQASKMLDEYYAKNPAKYSRLYPGVKKTLEYFNGKDMYVLTNRKRTFAEGAVKKLGIAKYFKGVLGGEDPSCRKPSRCVIDRSFFFKGIDRNKIIMIGDMDIDIRTGKDAGIRTCFAAYGFGKKKDIVHLKPDIIINDIRQLPEFISR